MWKQERKFSVKYKPENKKQMYLGEQIDKYNSLLFTGLA